jgi:hypothetical protein
MLHAYRVSTFLFGDLSLSLGCIPILFELIFLNLGS